MTNARPTGETFSEAQQSSGPAAPESSVHSSLSLPIFVFALLGTLDVPLTLAGLARGGVELVLLAHGNAALALVRVGTLLLVGVVLATFAPSAPRVARACAWLLVLIFALADTASILQLVIL